MNKKHFIFLGFLFIRLAFSQTPDGYFHSAAFNYIEKQIPAALADIETGLKLDPSNKKLHELLEKIKQEQKQQQQQKSQQNQQSDNKKDDQQKKDQNKEQEEKKEQKEDKSSPDQQKKSDEKKAEKQKQEKENQSNKADEEKQKGEKDKTPSASENDKKVKQISREAALQILKALENEEKNGKIKQRPVRSKGEKREHDW